MMKYYEILTARYNNMSGVERVAVHNMWNKTEKANPAYNREMIAWRILRDLDTNSEYEEILEAQEAMEKLYGDQRREAD